MAKKRIARVNEQMKRELITLLRGEVRDPRISTVTITDVEVSPDLYHAKVFFSVPGGDDEERATTLEGLRAASGFLRGEIGRRMHIRRAPELHFKVDETLQHAMHIERLLQDALASSGSPDTDDEDEAAADAANAVIDEDLDVAEDRDPEHDER